MFFFAFPFANMGAAGGQGASAYEPYPAPSGSQWAFVYEGTNQVFEGTAPVIEIVRIP